MNIDVTRVDGAGFCEDSINCRGLISGKFYIGAYTTIAKTAHLNNTLIGRFSTVQENVSIGMHVPNGKMLSSHKFCYSPYPDDYLKGISTLRLFEHTQKYTFIGNDVLIGAGSVICDGVRIGDGAIVKPNSYIDFDVPDYAITDGRSHVFEYRFNEVMRRLLILSKWWKKKINIPSDKNTWYGDEELLLRICTQDFDPLEKKLYAVENMGKADAKIMETQIRGIITGPSHAARWYSFAKEGKARVPKDYVLFPINAGGLISDEMKKLLDWAYEVFPGDSVLMVPNFRIGNTALKMTDSNARFINKNYLSELNDKALYLLGLERLDYFSKRKCLFIFWCMLRQEYYDRVQGKYLTDGVYKHPTFNYDELIDRYRDCSIDVKPRFLKDFKQYTMDPNGHPSLEAYGILSDMVEAR